jgi:NifU-like protein
MVYPHGVWKRAAAHVDRLPEEGTALGRAASFRCGCFIEFAVKVDERITSVTFRTNGCGYMIATADVLAETISGRELADLHGSTDGSLLSAIEARLGELPPERRQCAGVSMDAVRAAFKSHRSSRLEEFHGERALICTCFGVTEEAVEEFISANRPHSVDEVTTGCRAGGGCGSCRMLIQEMLDGSGAYDIPSE